MSIQFADWVQIGLLASSSFGIALIIYQMNQSKRLKQSDHFLYLSEKYWDLQLKFDSILEKSIEKKAGMTREDFLSRCTIDDITDQKADLFSAAQALVSLYKVEYELFRFGSIAPFHWRMWSQNFREDGEKKFWRDFWGKVKHRYANNRNFVRFMNRIFC